MTQVAFAAQLGIPLQRVNEIVRKKRGVSPYGLALQERWGRRTGVPEPVVADLEAESAAVKQRAAAKEAAAGVKGSPDGVAFLAAVKAADRAIRVAGEHKNDPMVRVLEAARAPLAEHLVSIGVRLPDRKAKRGRRKKGEPA